MKSELNICKLKVIHLRGQGMQDGKPDMTLESNGIVNALNNFSAKGREGC